MKRIRRRPGSAPAYLAAIGMFVFMGAHSAFAVEDGRDLVAEVWSRMRALNAERETMTVLLISSPEKPQYLESDIPQLTQEGKRGIVRKRAVRSMLYAADGHDKLSISFTEPAEDRGTGFLVWRQPGAPQDDQWLYLPALKRVRRIPSSSTQTFVGSNFSYEDIRNLTSESIERYEYKIVGDETVNGHPCTLVRATPRDSGASAYSGRTIAITKDSLFPVRTTLDDSTGAPWKILSNVDPREVAPKVFRPVLIEMRDLKLQETTVIVFDARETNPSLSPAIFTQDALERGAGE